MDQPALLSNVSQIELHKPRAAFRMIAVGWNLTEAEPRGPRFRNMLARLVSSLSESTDLGATQHLRALKQLADRTKGAWKAEWNEIQSVAARLERKQRRGGSDIET